MAVAARDTTVGVEFETVARACPSWPLLLSPKHVTVSLVNSAHVCAAPAATSDAMPPNDAVAVGVTAFDSWVVPSRPLVNSPQHHTAPITETAHECVLPISRCATVNEAGIKDAYTGVSFDVETALFPICPELPFPQHLTELSERAAQVVEPPAAIMRAVVPSSA